MDIDIFSNPELKYLENSLKYDITTLKEEEYIYFILDNKPVWYIETKSTKIKKWIGIRLFMTTNKISKNREDPFSFIEEMRKDSSLDLDGKKVPYLGTIMMKIFIEKYCKVSGFQVCTLISIRGSEGFYEKTLNSLKSKDIITNYEQDLNRFIIYI